MRTREQLDKQGLTPDITIGFGPGKEELAHQPDERVPIEQLSVACAFYANFPKEYCRLLVSLPRLKLRGRPGKQKSEREGSL